MIIIVNQKNMSGINAQGSKQIRKIVNKITIDNKKCLWRKYDFRNEF